MKLKTILVSALAATAVLASCNKDNERENNSNLSTYMTLEVVGQMSGQTKTTPGETVVGTDAENGITSVMVLLCNPDTKEVQYTYTVSSNLTAINGGVKTAPIQTVEGTFEVFVIANPTNEMVTTEENVLHKTITGVTEALMSSQYAAENTFLMFTECNGNGADELKGAAITITAENDYDHPATCATIKLDRLSAKITTKAEDVDISAIKGDGGSAEFSDVTAVELKGVKLLNGATHTYLQQHWSKSEAEQGAVAPYTNDLITPAVENSNTGFYNHISSFRTFTRDDNNTVTVAKDLYAQVPEYVIGSPLAPIYCMENNPSYVGNASVNALQGNTTGLVYQWSVTVNGSDGLAGNNCFYGYDGKYYATLDALYAEYPGVFAPETTGSTLEEKKDAAKTELSVAYADADRETKLSDFRAKYNVKVYTEGLMYYVYYIVDQNYQNADSEKYYSVMRNTVYGLNVRGLSRIGTDIPGGWNPDSDPTQPVDPTNVYMTVEVTVNPWVVSNEDIILK